MTMFLSRLGLKVRVMQKIVSITSITQELGMSRVRNQLNKFGNMKKGIVDFQEADKFVSGLLAFIGAV